MFDLEAGPIDVGDPPLWMPIFVDGLFGSKAADFAESRAGAEPTIVNAAIDVAGDGAPDEDGAYAVLAAPGEDVNGEESSSGGEPLPGSTLDSGEIVNVHAAAVAPYLPQPDGDVPVNFADPPSVNLSDYAPPTPPPPQYQNPDAPSQDTQL